MTASIVSDTAASWRITIPRHAIELGFQGRQIEALFTFDFVQ
jgi:hypothetical protein